jgi:hypothetical protein
MFLSLSDEADTFELVDLYDDTNLDRMQEGAFSVEWAVQLSSSRTCAENGEFEEKLIMIGIMIRSPIVLEAEYDIVPRPKTFLGQYYT